MAQRRSSAQQIRQQAYRSVLATAAGQDMLDDLVGFASAPGISEARALGRADVVNRMLRQKRSLADETQSQEESKE